MAKTTPATRGITRKRIRLMPIASSAAISWPTCMLPNSVQMAVPDRQITMNAVRSGPSSRTNVSSMILARKAPAPTCGNVVPAWMMMMRPSINAIAPTTGSASTPVNRIWRVMTRKTSPAPRGREELSEGTQTKNEDRRRELEALERLPAGPSNHTGRGEGLPSRDVLLLPVCQEFLQADVGQWMLDELLEDGKRHGTDVP